MANDPFVGTGIENPAVIVPTPVVQGAAAPIAVNGQSNLKPFKSGNKKGNRMNFFKRQEQKYGNEWSVKNRNLSREISGLIVDFAKGNIGQEDIMYFYDRTFSEVIRTVCAEQVFINDYRVQCGRCYMEKMAVDNKQVLPQYQKYYQDDMLRLEIWKDMYNFLFILAQASRYGTQQVISEGMKFANYMLKYRTLISIHLF